jgi:hypothetical protein
MVVDLTVQARPVPEKLEHPLSEKSDEKKKRPGRRNRLRRHRKWQTN